MLFEEVSPIDAPLSAWAGVGLGFGAAAVVGVALGSGLIARTRRLQQGRWPRRRRSGICHSVLRPVSSL